MHEQDYDMRVEPGRRLDWVRAGRSRNQGGGTFIRSARRVLECARLDLTADASAPHLIAEEDR